MKNIIKYSFTSIVAFLYLFTAIGFDIHTCTASGTVQVVLPFGVPDCNHINHHDCTHTGICDVIHHDNNCCSNKSYSLEDNYTDSRTQHSESFSLSVVFLSCDMPANDNYLPKIDLTTQTCDNLKAPPLISVGYNKLLNTWRL